MKVLIKKNVGNTMQNDSQDVIQVKAALARIGYFEDDGAEGIITRSFDTALKNFQKDKNLKADGIMIPGGETHNAIQVALNSTPPVPSRKPEQIHHTLETFFPKIVQMEGEYTAGKFDRRGATNAGINYKTLEDYKSWKVGKGELLPKEFTTDVARVTPSLAKKIYNEMYYREYGFDKVPDAKTAGHMLDIAINMGPRKAVKWFQEELGRFLDRDVDADGILGSDTRQSIVDAKRKGILRQVNNAVVEKRKNDYRSIAARRPSDKKHLAGWLSRADAFSEPPLPGRKPKW